MSKSGQTRQPDGGFHTTRWTRVLAASGDSEDARTALSELCELYYEPVRVFVRHHERVGEDEARELAHAFFARLLERQSVGQPDPARGRFRSYLLGAVKHFLRDHRRRQRAAKRGGGEADLPLDAAAELAAAPASEAAYDREWALALLARALEQVAAATGDSERFRVLKPWLTGNPPHISQTDAARELGVSEGAIKVAIHRLRRRLRDTIRQEIATTLDSDDETGISAELNTLIQALAGG